MARSQPPPWQPPRGWNPPPPDPPRPPFERDPHRRLLSWARGHPGLAIVAALGVVFVFVVGAAGAATKQQPSSIAETTVSQTVLSVAPSPLPTQALSTVTAAAAEPVPVPSAVSPSSTVPSGPASVVPPAVQATAARTSAARSVASGPATQAAAPPAAANPPPAAAGASCYPLTSGGNCYQAGEYCRAADHGAHGVAKNGEAIVCAYNNGWRWEPA
jgi:hypothetical protein